MGEVDAVVAGTSCDRRRHGTVVCSGAESSVSPKSDISKNITYIYSVLILIRSHCYN